ncbi:PREDICTED: uncharacterized protein LOC109238936 [Nicotiana attenuata]|uniref:Uncharacterized protein n=1 Tax=Nicotiana attenuata TaxID=49451 RepID=A0A314LAJ0_NICAT|nr:PREDICTED: uncharacterized protein LOC109238936 [Nicotiana attenuata]OIT38791.1 hypothetical protein A4A49_10328 [Nicotiana attenuata]
MNLQSACSLLQHEASIPKCSQFQFHNVSVSSLVRKNNGRSYVRLEKRNPFAQNGLKFIPSLKKGLIVYASNSSPPEKLNYDGRESRSVSVIASNGSEPFRGKSGSVSFHGLTHQLIEESKLVSAPFEEKRSSFLWVLAPIALISSLVLPRFFIAVAVDDLIKNATFAEIVSSFFSEVMFYIGLATYLRVTDHVQKPYLQFSAKRWSLITGLKGYITSAFFVMGFKIFAPLFALYVTWPSLGLPGLVAVAPFLLSCLVQYLFEKFLDRHGSSSWPVVPIIFEVYRIYQLTRSVHFVEKLMFAMSGAPVTPELFDRNGALVALIVTFQVLGITCLWSLLTFLQRLFPSRPVSENY